MWWWLAWLYNVFGLSGGLTIVAIIELVIALAVLAAAVAQAIYFFFWVIRFFWKESRITLEVTPSPSNPPPVVPDQPTPPAPPKGPETIEEILNTPTDEDRKETQRFFEEFRRKP